MQSAKTLKVQIKKEVHLYRGESNIEDLSNFIRKCSKKVPENFQLNYIDEDKDTITVSCTDDLVALLETNKNPKLQVVPKAESSEESGNEQLEKEEEKESEEEKMKKLLEEKKKRKEEKRAKFEQMRKEFMENCKHDEKMSKCMQKTQEKLKKHMPKIQEFIETDFTYQEPTEEQKAKIEENKEKMHKFKQQAPFKIMKFARKMMRKMRHPSSDSEEQRQHHGFPGMLRGFMHPGMRGPQGPFHRGPHHDRPHHKGPHHERPHHRGPHHDRPHHPRGPHHQEDSENRPAVWRRVVCDGCEQYPLIGTRYKCQERHDFDLCSTCFQKEEQKNTFKAMEKPEHPMFPMGPHPFFDMFNMQQQFGNQQNSENSEKKPLIWRRVACDGCNQFPLIGTRYKCQERANFDLCTTCYEKDDQKHKFQAMEKKGCGKGRKRFENKPKKCEKSVKVEKVQEKVEKSEETMNTTVSSAEILIADEQKAEQFEKVETQTAQTSDEKQIPLKKEFSKETYARAQTVSEVFGGKVVEYLGVCDFFTNLTVDQIIGELLEQPELLVQHSSF